jgi:U3 small nucleolar RNA-associated protein 10
LVIFQSTLFSNTLKHFDRFDKNVEENEKINSSIDSCLKLLSPYFLESATEKVLEWLLFRWRIHEFNINSIIIMILPYHDTMNFIRMMKILKIKENHEFGFFNMIKESSGSLGLSKKDLVFYCLKSNHLIEFILKNCLYL